MLRRRPARFVDLVERQLDLFEHEQAELIADTDEALRAYNEAGRDEAEQRYERFLDAVETAQDELVALRDTYANTLDEDAADEYRDVFNAAVRKRLPRFGLELD